MFRFPQFFKRPDVERERERLEEQTKVTIQGQKKLDDAIDALLRETLKRKASDG